MSAGIGDKMNALECIPCVLDQTLRTLQAVGADDHQKKQIMQGALVEVRSMLDGASAPEATRYIFKNLMATIKNHDPFREFKKASTRAALDMFPRLKKTVSAADNPFAKAIELSVAGNVIDLATITTGDLLEVFSWLDRFTAADFAVNDISELEKEIKGAKVILVIGDNAGETVFDRLFIELIDGPELYYGVRGAPVLNDAVESDAIEAGIEASARIVSSGSTVPGTLLSDVSDEFSALFDSADVVIAKGQGNFETLDKSPRPVYHLFKAKCKAVAAQIGCNIGDFVVWRRE